MKVKILSDLHIHPSHPFKYTDHGEDVVVLAGDIDEGVGGVLWAEICIPKDKQVLYVPGNHEYYGQNYDALNSWFKQYNESGTNIKVLLNDTFTKDDWGIEFVGSTLWVDFNLYGNQPVNEVLWRQGLNDSRYISVGDRKCTADDFKLWNRQALEFMMNVESKKQLFLITHYCPERSVASCYVNDPLTPGFATRIPNVIHKKFAYHAHGHTHTSFDYIEQDSIRVICNPRGYGSENKGSFDDGLVITYE